MTTWMILPLLFVPALGVALLVRGLRGRRVDDHPICRRCGFDLVGRPQTSDRCPECGAELSAPKAIRLGRRERRKSSLAAGAVLLTLVGAAGVVLFSGMNWDRYKPTWLLAREAEDPARGARAAAELIRRLGAGRLSDAQIASTADRFLAVQGDKKRPWPPACGDFIDAARRASKLGNDRYDRYLRQAAQLLLKVRPTVRRGEVLPCLLESKPARLGTGWPPLSGFGQMIGHIGAARYQSNFQPGFSPWGPNGATLWSIPSARFDGQITDGPQSINLNVDIQVYSTGRHYVVNVAAPFEVLPAWKPSVQERRDASLRPAIEKALRVKNASFPFKRFRLEVQIQEVPVGVAFDVWARHRSGLPVLIGGFAAPPRQQRSFFLVQRISDFAVGDRIDVIFRPNPRVATSTLDVMEAWVGEEIVIPDVPVIAPATTKAAS